MRVNTTTLVLFTGLAAVACGGTPDGPSGTAELTVRLTDSPFSDAKALLVTFSEVSVHRDGAGWERIPFVGDAAARTCDLKKLVAAADVLGTEPLPAGHYTQVRLAVASAALYFDNESTGPACAASIAPPDGRMEPVTIPSGVVRLNREFTLAADMPASMLLDFDGDRSVHATGTGGYTMTPVIAVVSVQ